MQKITQVKKIFLQLYASQLENLNCVITYNVLNFTIQLERPIRKFITYSTMSIEIFYLISIIL